ncbi:MAG: class I SAM-dependent methyltransferase [Hellea sp.]|nr:class I SAM-dependent methyltransferase [Hellea sp.]
MSSKSLSPAEIISKALSDPEEYKRMAAGEDAHWSKTLSDPDRAGKRKKGQQAARILKKNRDNFSVYSYLRNQKGKIKHGLVLGCGSGRAERTFLEKGVGESFHGIDIAAGAVETAKKVAAENNLPITYEVADLNDVILQKRKYDFVSAQNFLHHVVKLEHLFEQIWKSLKPNGYLYIDDFVGETQFQWSEKRLKITTEILELLPTKHRTDVILDRPVRQPHRPDPGKLCSPFEAIRSGEILPQISRWFNVKKQVLSGSIRYHVLPLGVLESYTENEDTKTIYEVLRYVDRLLVDEGVLPPSAAQILLSPKRPEDIG